MAESKGKKWEKIFRKDFKRTFPDSFIDRIPDQTSYLKGSEN